MVRELRRLFDLCLMEGMDRCSHPCLAHLRHVRKNTLYAGSVQLLDCMRGYRYHHPVLSAAPRTDR